MSDIVFIGLYGTAAFFAAFVLAPAFIRLLLQHGVKKTIRTHSMDGQAATVFQQLHGHKAGTPTMGGILVWGTVLGMVLLSRVLSAGGWGYEAFPGLGAQSLLQRTQVYLPLFTLIVCSLLGLADDLINLQDKPGIKGISARFKTAWLLLFGGLGAWWFFSKLGYSLLYLPFIGTLDIGWLYVPLFMFVIYAGANAANITDGLDGLAGGLLAIAYGAYIVIALEQGMVFLAAFCAVVVGALCAFLWFNVAPARFFMGDTGSLGLGATLGVIAMLTNTVALLPIIGLLFIVELGSSGIQILSKKYLGRKVFLIAPLHHHLERLGWQESQVTMRFWLLGGMCAALGVLLYLLDKGA